MIWLVPTSYRLINPVSSLGPTAWRVRVRSFLPPSIRFVQQKTRGFPSLDNALIQQQAAEFPLIFTLKHQRAIFARIILDIVLRKNVINFASLAQVVRIQGPFTIQAISILDKIKVLMVIQIDS